MHYIHGSICPVLHIPPCWCDVLCEVLQWKLQGYWCFDEPGAFLCESCSFRQARCSLSGLHHTGKPSSILSLLLLSKHKTTPQLKGFGDCFETLWLIIISGTILLTLLAHGIRDEWWSLVHCDVYLSIFPLAPFHWGVKNNCGAVSHWTEWCNCLTFDQQI